MYILHILAERQERWAERGPQLWDSETDAMRSKKGREKRVRMLERIWAGSSITMLAQVQTWSDGGQVKQIFPHRWRLVQLTPQALGQHGKEAQLRAQLGPPVGIPGDKPQLYCRLPYCALEKPHAIFLHLRLLFFLQLCTVGQPCKFAKWKKAACVTCLLLPLLPLFTSNFFPTSRAKDPKICENKDFLTSKVSRKTAIAAASTD